MYKNVLEKIISVKKTEVFHRKQQISEASLRKVIETVAPARDFTAAIKNDPNVSLIAEVKKASPSQGIIREDFEPVRIAETYEKHGATCISVLTDTEFFQGKLEYLGRIRDVVQLPVLRKDFVIDPHQVLEARSVGADAVLLIAECLDDQQLRGLRELIESLGMTALVEFYEPENLERVIDSGATLIGINNRDLKTFEISIEHAMNLRQRIDREIPVVAESGIFTFADVKKLSAANIDAMLVGQSLMEQDDIATAVRKILGKE